MEDQRQEVMQEATPARSRGREERRAWKRYDVCWPFVFSCSNGALYEGVCTNINEGGLRFKTDGVLAVGTVIDAEFLAGDSDCGPHAPVRARILYRMGDEYGATFIASPKLGMTAGGRS